MLKEGQLSPTYLSGNGQTLKQSVLDSLDPMDTAESRYINELAASISYKLACAYG